MANELAQTKNDIRVLEGKLLNNVKKSSPQFQSEFNKLRGEGKSVGDAYQGATDFRLGQIQAEKSSSSSLVAKQELRNKAASSQGKRKEWYLNLLSSLDNAASSTGDAFEGLDKYTINTLKNFNSTYSFIQEGILTAASDVTNTISGATKGIQQFEQEALHDIQGWGAGIKKALEPVGLASAIGDLTDVAKNPLGAPQFLANSITSLVGKISPKFVQQMDDSVKSLKLEGLAHLPSKMMGSIRSLATAADAILSVPFEIMSDVYNGLMDILEAIADLIDSLVTMVMNIAMAVVKALVDAIIPVDELLEFFSAIGDLASFVGDIAGMVGGFSAVTNITSQVSNFASSATSAINNPLQAIPGASGAISQITSPVSQFTSALRNPEQFLPPEIGQQMQKISSIPGLGFVGNLGYSVGDTLDSLSEGVLSKALEKYADKSPMIKSFFNKPQDEPPAVDTQETYSDDFTPSKVPGTRYPSLAAGGIPSGTAPKILSNGSSADRPYGIGEERPNGEILMEGVQTSFGTAGKTPYNIDERLIAEENAAARNRR